MIYYKLFSNCGFGNQKFIARSSNIKTFLQYLYTTTISSLDKSDNSHPWTHYSPSSEMYAIYQCCDTQNYTTHHLNAIMDTFYKIRKIYYYLFENRQICCSFIFNDMINKLCDNVNTNDPFIIDDYKYLIMPKYISCSVELRNLVSDYHNNQNILLYETTIMPYAMARYKDDVVMFKLKMDADTISNHKIYDVDMILRGS